MVQQITYFPQDGGVYAGGHMAIDEVDHTQYLTTIVEDPTKNSLFSAKFIPAEHKTALFAQKYNWAKQFAETAPGIANVARQVHMRLKAKRDARRYPQIHNFSAALNDSAIEQLTIVQFVKDIIGQMENVTTISKAFSTIQSNNLRGKIPEGAWPDVSIQVDRLSEPLITHTDFGQEFFRIKRNDVHIYISREDRMEASIDPYSFSTARAQKQLLQARDLMALVELSTLTAQTDLIPNPTEAKSATTVIPRAVNDTAGDFLKIITNHYTTYRNLLKHVVINNLDFRACQTNFYLRNNIKVEAAQGWGVVPFPGLAEQGIMAHISPWVPRGNVYFLADEGNYEINGPKVVDSEYDARKFADYTPIRDFVGYQISNPGRFSTRAAFDGIDGVTTKDQITTYDAIEELLKPPAVKKNPDAN